MASWQGPVHEGRDTRDAARAMKNRCRGRRRKGRAGLILHNPPAVQSQVVDILLGCDLIPLIPFLVVVRLWDVDLLQPHVSTGDASVLPTKAGAGTGGELTAALMPTRRASGSGPDCGLLALASSSAS